MVMADRSCSPPQSEVRKRNGICVFITEVQVNWNGRQVTRPPLQTVTRPPPQSELRKQGMAYVCSGRKCRRKVPCMNQLIMIG